MADSPRHLDPARRAELVALLEERARRLQPDPQLIERALERCFSSDRTRRSQPLTASTPRQEGASARLPASTSARSAAVRESARLAPAKDASARLPVDSGPEALLAESPVTPSAPVQAVAPDHPDPTAKTMPESAGPISVGKKARKESDDGAGTVLPPGVILAGYRIEALLGEGGMGQVYRATQLSMSRQVAFKVLAVRFSSHRRFRERFLREARAAGRLHHPNLIAVHDVGEANGRMFFSMELVNGVSLRQLLRQRGPLPEAQILDYAAQCLHALRYAHERGVIHRDIKPDNLMVTGLMPLPASATAPAAAPLAADATGESTRMVSVGASGSKPAPTAVPSQAGQPGWGVLKVADLGLSRTDPDKMEDGGTDFFTTQTGAMLGTPHYMAPEQSRDAHTADPRADLYGLGATLYALAVGRPPFDGQTAMEIIIHHSRTPVTFPDPVPPATGVSPGLRALIVRLMAKEPAQRPASAAAALELVERLRQGAPLDAPSPWRRRLRWLLASLLLLGLGAVAWCFARPHLDQMAWNADVLRIRAHAEAGRWQDGLADLRGCGLRLEREVADAQTQLFMRWNGAVAMAQRRQAEAAALRTDLEHRWDAAALARLGADLDQAEVDAKAGNRKALVTVDRIDKDKAWLSPAIEERIDAIRELLEKPPAADGTSLRELRDAQSRKARLLAGWWGRFLPEPAEALRVSGATAIFTGSGTAVRSGPGMGVWIPIRVTWSAGAGALPPGSACWILHGAEGPRLQVDQRGLVLINAAGERVLEPWQNQVVRFQLKLGEGTVAIRLRPDQQRPPTAQFLGDLRCTWKLPPGAHVQAEILDPRRGSGPAGPDTPPPASP